VSARLVRLSVSTGAAALALGLVAPSSAFANDDRPGGGGQDDRDSTSHHGTRGGESGARGDGADPAGNNGTIKIQPYGGIDGHRNVPHPGCDFRLQLWNFDDDQTGTITFVGHAPTAGAVTTQPAVTSGHPTLSDDAAGGGQDSDAFFDIRGSQLGLTGTPQGKHGFHVKVLVNADNAPGGAKQKVFWLNCPTTAAAGPLRTSGGGTLTTNKVESLSQAGTSGSTVGGASTPQRSTVQSQSASDESVLSGGRASAVRATSEPSAAAAERGSALPFTGTPALALIAMALAALSAGALAVWAGRPRTSLTL
jgi:hypothetical protein